MLILYTANLLKLLITPKSFLVESSESFNYSIISANRDNLCTSFPACTPFIFFSCLAALAKNSSSNIE
jgi:hypothetical protein